MSSVNSSPISSPTSALSQATPLFQTQAQAANNAPSQTPTTPSPLNETEDERALREIRESMLSSSPVIGPDGSIDAMAPGGFSLSSSVIDPSLVSSTHQESYRNELVNARRLAARAKLHPYQREDVDAFTKDTPLGRQVRLLIENYVISNKLDTIVTATPVFTISEALQGTINGYAMAVLLSAKLSAYKGTIPRDHVMRILFRSRVNLPTNVEQDQYAMNLLKETVQDTLTQYRSRIKKGISRSKADIGTGPDAIQDAKDNSQSIFELATQIITSTRCTITVQLCARIAFLRKVHCDVSDSKFWNTVDKRLALIRREAKGDEKRLIRAFGKILAEDRGLYGPATDVDRMAPIPEYQSSPWQQGVDNDIMEEVNSRRTPEV